jgi:predicted nucleotidyltransferase
MEIRRAELDQACARLGARLLVLFGSYAPGGLEPRPESDVDLALAFRRGAR